MTTQDKVKIQVWVLIVVVFVLGGVTGGALDRLYLANREPIKTASANPGRGPNRVIERWRGELNLNDDQVAKIRTIFEESRKEFPPNRFAECPGFKESRARTRSRVRELLTTEQQKRFDDMNAHRDAEVNK